MYTVLPSSPYDCKLVKQHRARMKKILADDRVYYDAEIGDQIKSFVEKNIRIYNKGDGQELMTLPVWLEHDVLRPLFGFKWKANDKRIFKRAYISVPRKQGKALCLDTEIPTVNGFKLMRDIEVGDVVFDELGNRANVTFVSEVFYNHECYVVKFSDGAEIRADAGHIWTVREKQSTGYSFVDKTTKDMYCDYLMPRNDGNLERRYSVLVNGSVDYDHKDLLIPPYILGVWLGGGTRTTSYISSSKEDSVLLKQFFEELGYGCELTQDKTCVRILPIPKNGPVLSRSLKRPSMVGNLRTFNLLNNKHIPDCYKYSSREQRLELLRGLLDSDGTVTNDYVPQFSNNNKRLIDDVAELVNSLGYKCRTSSKMSKLNGNECGLTYNITFTDTIGDRLFKLDRKQNKVVTRDKSTRSSTKQIVSIEKVDSFPTKCISVDTPSKLYLATRNFIPTHNTFCMAATMLYPFFTQGKKQEMYVIASKYSQAMIAFNDILNFVRSSPPLEQRCYIPGVSIHRYIEYKGTKKEPGNGNILKPLSSDSRLHGLRPSMCILDEFHQFTKPLYDALDTALKSQDQPLLIAITTAGEDPSGECYREYDYSKSLLEGVNESFDYFCYIAETDQEVHWATELAYKQSNVSLGLTIDESAIKEDLHRAQVDPSTKYKYINLTLNKWMRGGSGVWINAEDWKKVECDIPYEELRDQPVYMGLDLSECRDFTSLAMVCPYKDKVYVWHKYYLPSETISNYAQEGKIPANIWEDTGYLTSINGTTIDPMRIVQDIEEMQKIYNVKGLSYDEPAGIVFRTPFGDHGIDAYKFVQSPLNYTPPMNIIEKMVFDQKIAHEPNPITTWMVYNTHVHNTKTNLKMLKKDLKMPHKKIDGIAALIFATDLWQRLESIPKETKTDYYEDLTSIFGKKK